jgi:hypothetical protein
MIIITDINQIIDNIMIIIKPNPSKIIGSKIFK